MLLLFYQTVCIIAIQFSEAIYVWLLLLDSETVYAMLIGEGIGQKLMNQMGWEKGKGLGSNLQGEKDPIKVKTNIESRGEEYYNCKTLYT